MLLRAWTLQHRSLAPLDLLLWLSVEHLEHFYKFLALPAPAIGLQHVAHIELLYSIAVSLPLVVRAARKLSIAQLREAVTPELVCKFWLEA